MVMMILASEPSVAHEQRRRALTLNMYLFAEFLGQVPWWRHLWRHWWPKLDHMYMWFSWKLRPNLLIMASFACNGPSGVISSRGRIGPCPVWERIYPGTILGTGISNFPLTFLKSTCGKKNHPKVIWEFYDVIMTSLPPNFEMWR